MAMKQRAFEDSKPDYGLEYPPYDEDTYPECVPAFTQTVSIGFIGIRPNPPSLSSLHHLQE